MIVPSPSPALQAAAEAPVDATVLAELHQLDEGGPPAIFSELVALFSESAPRLLSQARLVTDDPAQLTVIAHTLKGSCSNFGAHRMGALCLELEQLALQGKNERTRTVIDATEQEFFRVRKALESHCV